VGGGSESKLNRLKHAIGIAKHVIVPETKYAIAVRLQYFGSLRIRSCHRRVLTTVDFHNEPRSVTGEVDDVLLDPHLPTEMRIGDRKAMTKVPPELSFSLSGRGAHLACEPALRRRGD
jgi:hypothetical protein